MAGVHLPDDILRNILARLPAKDLLRLIGVSRDWKRMIRDPRLMKSRSSCKILVTCPDLVVIDSNLPADDIVRLPPPYEHPEIERVVILGTFNGIVVLDLSGSSFYDHMLLYNPLTRASKKLPYPPLPHIGSRYAFGVGATIDDFKIVRISGVGYNPVRDSHVCDVYSLKKRSWSTIINFAPEIYFKYGVGMFFNGYLHWRAMKSDVMIIVALSVNEMVLSVMNLPNGCSNSSWTHLGELYGRLCAIQISYPAIYDMWVMKEHGVQNSWSKAYSFILHVDISGRMASFKPICITHDGRIIMTDYVSRVIIYDTLKGSYRLLKAFATPLSYRTTYCTEYVESMVSPSQI